MNHNWTLAELRNKTEVEIEAQFDMDTKKYQDSASSLPFEFYLNELQRRENEKTTKKMLRYTLWITLMTFVMTLATIANLYPIFRDALKKDKQPAVIASPPTPSSS